MPTVSVIIPFYNRVKWLREALQSVFAQTYQDFEVIVIDDGSSESLDGLDELKEERIRYVRQQNKGPAAARNAGLALARGRYIAFLDADDIFLPMKLERQVSCMEQNPDIMLSHTSYQLMTSEGKYVGDVKAGRFSGRVYPKIAANCPIQTSNVMLRREAVVKGFRFEEDARVGEDVILWSQIARKSPILGIDEPLAKFRIHSNYAAYDPKQQITGLMNIIEYVIRRDPDISFILRRRLLSDIYLTIGRNYLHTRNICQFLKFLGLAEYMQPLNPPYFMMIRLSSMLHLAPLGRFRQIYGKLKNR